MQADFSNVVSNAVLYHFAKLFAIFLSALIMMTTTFISFFFNIFSILSQIQDPFCAFALCLFYSKFTHLMFFKFSSSFLLSFYFVFCRRILKSASYIVELTDKEENMSDGRGVNCEKGACGKVEGEENVQLHTRACCESKTQNINLLSVSQSMRDRATSTESLTCTIDLGMESDEEVPHCGN